jgi:signal transduction histidine kinase
VTGVRGDRFDAVLAAARRISRSRSPAEVRVALCDGVRAVIGATHCVIVDPVGDPPADAEGSPLRAALVAAALRAGQVAIWPGDLAFDPPVEPVRTALCAPLALNVAEPAVLYATHPAVGAFGDDERRIAGFLAAIAASALDNSVERSHMRDSAQELERRFATIRTELLHAGRMAAVGTVFAGLSHELNNPLTVIVGHVENLRRLAGANDQVARVIDAVERHATRAARLVNALLRYSRAGTLGYEEVSPDELINLVTDLLAAEARRREIELRVTVPHGLHPVYVVRHDIESALVNITTNALQATPEGGVVELSVRAEPRDTIAGVRFVARDTGVGIPPEILPQIFNPFFTTKPEGEGTGLGLSLAREIASAHGGELAVESTVGRGTTMSLWLPERGDGDPRQDLIQTH